MLPLAIMAAVGLAALLASLSKPKAAALAGVALIGTTLEYRTEPILWSVAPPVPMMGLGVDATSIVLDLPLPAPDRLDASVDVHYMVSRIGTWNRTLNGYSGHFPAHYLDLVEAFRHFPSAEAMSRVAAAGTTHIAVHERWLGTRYQEWSTWLQAQDAWRLVAEYGPPGGRVALFMRAR